ncbi:MAG: DUF2834 domain-containing protein [Gammaproteobacteria bacterium]|nr:DUF2834 domain-containing protein [Gammaproteobacteria bacterium]
MQQSFADIGGAADKRWSSNQLSSYGQSQKPTRKQGMKQVLIITTLLAFGYLTGVAVWKEGIIGIFSSITSNYGSMQIFADLVIALVLALVWMWHDAKAIGRNVWPWMVLTLLAGSFGPLLYLLTRKKNQ